MKKSLLAALAAFLAVAASAATAGAEPSFESNIVVFEPGAVPNIHAAAQGLAAANAGEVGFVYENALEGFSVRIPAGRANALAHDPRVAYVEADQVVQADTTQSPATWGLDRIDQRNLPLSNSYAYNQTGAGLTAYAIDTRIRAPHRESAGRIGNGFTAISDGNGTNDCNGHGTHVAGT